MSPHTQVRMHAVRAAVLAALGVLIAEPFGLLSVLILSVSGYGLGIYWSTRKGHPWLAVPIITYDAARAAVHAVRHHGRELAARRSSGGKR